MSADGKFAGLHISKLVTLKVKFIDLHVEMWHMYNGALNYKLTDWLSKA